MEWRREDGYWVSDEPSLVDLERVHHWLSVESYWATGRPLEVVRRSFEGSVLLGCYGPDATQVGFSRLVTDRATFGWLCDVFVDARHRGKGLGLFLVESAVEHPAVKGLRLVLATRDAQGLYAKYGFAEPTTRFMEKRPQPLS
jgi:GNAT superfamily N-acetyltransferase